MSQEKLQFDEFHLQNLSTKYNSYKLDQLGLCCFSISLSRESYTADINTTNEQ